MKKKIYMKPTIGVVNAEGEELMAASLNANSIGISDGGNASENNIISADSKGTSLWADDEE